MRTEAREECWAVSGRGEKPDVVGCLCGRRVAHFDKDNDNKG
jgi:hypothetical protein